jgi:hypothetical protein
MENSSREAVNFLRLIVAIMIICNHPSFVIYWHAVTRARDANLKPSIFFSMSDVTGGGTIGSLRIHLILLTDENNLRMKIVCSYAGACKFCQIDMRMYLIIS